MRFKLVEKLEDNWYGLINHNGKFYIDETPLIILKQSHSRF